MHQIQLDPEFEERIIRECERSGLELPDRIKNAPTLRESMKFYMQAFSDLSSERQLGFGVGPIPITSILKYAKHFELDEDEESDLIYFVKEMDSAYLDYVGKKNGDSAKR